MNITGMEWRFIRKDRQNAEAAAAFVAQNKSSLALVAGAGLLDTDNTWSVHLATDPGLEFDAGGDDGKLRVKVYANHALIRDANGLYVKVWAEHGLEANANGLYIAPKADSVVIVDENGLDVAVDPGTADCDLPLWNNTAKRWEVFTLTQIYDTTTLPPADGNSFVMTVGGQTFDALALWEVPADTDGVDYTLFCNNGGLFWAAP